MIYNAAASFLFIHIQKNAGTAISEALQRIPGSRLIMPAHLRFRDVRVAKARRPFVFAVCRNPWSRLVSWYEMMLRKGPHNDFSRYLLAPAQGGTGLASFSEFIRRTAVIDETNPAEFDGETRHRFASRAVRLPRYRKSIGFNQLEYLLDRTGRSGCDQVLRFERIGAEWPQLWQRLTQAPDASPLPRVNENPSPGNWRDRYADPRDIDWVRSLYARDIEAFGYDFDAD